MSQEIVRTVLWVAILAIVAFVLYGGMKNKKKYAGRSMEITQDWYGQSQSRYPADYTKKAYFFTYDKNYLTQGHIMMDRNRRPVYEAKILYGNPAQGYEADFTNHIISYTHHHKIGAVASTSVGGENSGVTLTSSFKFDGTDIMQYMENLGYDYHFSLVGGLAYRIDVMKNGENVGTIYSSNNGKNYFDCDGPIVPKAGGKGIVVVECAYRNLDAMFLYAMMFAKTELSAQNLK